MKPSEKAKQLYEKMKFETEFNSQPSTINGMCKNLALVLANEAQDLLNKPMFQYKESMLWIAEFEYWDKVKHEISLL